MSSRPDLFAVCLDEVGRSDTRRGGPNPASQHEMDPVHLWDFTLGPTGDPAFGPK